MAELSHGGMARRATSSSSSTRSSASSSGTDSLSRRSIFSRTKRRASATGMSLRPGIALRVCLRGAELPHHVSAAEVVAVVEGHRALEPHVVDEGAVAAFQVVDEHASVGSEEELGVAPADAAVENGELHVG